MDFGRVMEKGVPIGPFFPIRTVQGRIEMVVGMVAPSMVEGYVHDHGNASGVALIHEGLEIIWCAIRMGNGVIEDRVIAPTRITGEGVDGHHLDGVDAGAHEVGNLAAQAAKIAVDGRDPSQLPAASRTQSS